MIRSFTRGIDWILVGAVLPIIWGGLATMTAFAGSASLFNHQLLWALLGLASMFLITWSDVRYLRDSRYIVLGYGVCVALLVLVLLVGKSIKGAKSWFNFGLFSFQPTDIMKLFALALLSKYFSRRHVEIARFKHLFVSALYVLVPAVLIALQPDFGYSVIFIGLWLGMALVAGISYRQILLVIGIGVLTFAVLWLAVFKPYQKDRIRTFINPSSDIRGRGYNVYQSVIAVGSGGFLGKGVGYGTQSRLNYLPEYQTDFIFAAFAEEWGFVGSLVILFCFCLIFWRIILHATRGASNFETLFCVGYALLLFGHITVNIGMNAGIVPVTGLPLPFMSYGGSHLLGEFIGLGIILSMARYERAIHPDDIHNEFIGHA